MVNPQVFLINNQLLNLKIIIVMYYYSLQPLYGLVNVHIISLIIQ